VLCDQQTCPLEETESVEDFTAPQVTPDDHIRGPADAPVTILEYGDYECPYCRGAFRDVHRLVDQHPTLIRFVFRNFPISQLHPHAEQAAEAAEAAAAQGKFWEMYELLLQPYSHLDTDSLVTYAEVVGLDIARFRRDLTDHAYAVRIQADVQDGIKNGVNQTPKFYVNGERVDGKVPLENLAELVQRAISAAQG
jgi:protein-disulfide isomerase